MGIEWNEILLLILSEAGFFYLAFKAWVSWIEKEKERQHELQKLKIVNPAKSIRDSIYEFDRVYDAIDRINSQFKADTTLYIKLGNGKIFADKTHIWKYSAVMYSGGDRGAGLRNDIQERLTAEAPKTFARLEANGFAYEKSLTTEKANILEQRIINAGYDAYLMVATKDCFKAFLVCWDTTKMNADGVDITPEIAKLVQSELLSIADILPT